MAAPCTPRAAARCSRGDKCSAPVVRSGSRASRVRRNGGRASGEVLERPSYSLGQDGAANRFDWVACRPMPGVPATHNDRRELNTTVTRRAVGKIHAQSPSDRPDPNSAYPGGKRCKHHQTHSTTSRGSDPPMRSVNAVGTVVGSGYKCIIQDVVLYPKPPEKNRCSHVRAVSSKPRELRSRQAATILPTGISSSVCT